VEAEWIGPAARELAAVVGVALAGLALAAAVAFTPWYGVAAAEPAVIELRGPVGPAAPAEQR
jgi:hypothetical protein